MKYLKLCGVMPALAILLTCVSCNTEPGFAPVPKDGSVSFALRQDPGNTIVVKGAASDNLPEVDDFKVQIYNSASVRLYKKMYSEAKNDIVRLNAGMFRMTAHCGDSLGCGFDKPYFLADTTFEVFGAAVTGGIPQIIKTTARLANVKVRVDFGINLTEGYSDFRAIIRHTSYPDKSVTFTKDETRSAYIPGGEVCLEVYATYPPENQQNANKTVYFKSSPVKYSPNDFVTFGIDSGEGDSSLKMNITVNTEVETVIINGSIPQEALPSGAPSFTCQGAQGKEFALPFAIGDGGIKPTEISFLALGGVAQAVMTVNSQYFTALNGEIDLLNPTQEQEAALKDAGISASVFSDARLGAVSLTEMLRSFATGGRVDLDGETDCAEIELKITDKYGRTATASASISGNYPEVTVNINDYDVWSSKAVDLKAAVGVGKISDGLDMALQYRETGTDIWNTATVQTIKDTEILFSDITGLKPDTDYEVRSIINGKESSAKEHTGFHTEEETQIGNSGFEEITEKQYSTSVVWTSSKFNVKFWELYSQEENAWWATNSRRTILASAAAAYPDYKTYPTVAVYSDGAYSGYSLMIATISNGTATSEISYGTPHEAEVFIGKGNTEIDNGWAKVSEGHDIHSRPSALEFMYRFDVHQNKPFLASVEILDAEGNVIGSGRIDNVSQDVNNWTVGHADINYTNPKVKAASIKVRFLSQSQLDGSRKITVNTLSGKHTIHAGSILYLDDVKLKY